jgi:hypothetical protein
MKRFFIVWGPVICSIVSWGIGLLTGFISGLRHADRDREDKEAKAE